MKKNTKIVATISDRRCDVEFLRELHASGMDVVRLNTAHQEPADALKVIDNVRKVSDKIAILVDTKGPEIRTMKTLEEVAVKKGDIIRIKGDPAGVSQGDLLYVSYPNFVDEVPVGAHILMDDGDLEFVVLRKQDEALVCEVQNSGMLKARKSINVPNVHINLPSLSDKDRRFVEFAIQEDVTFIAHSFVRNKEDVIAIQEILDQHNSQIKIIAKIENQIGVDNIDEILSYAYGVMVARGDLGIEIAAERIPGIQRMLVEKCVARKKPVIIATQMLHSMIKNPRPTRAEISDIANAAYHATDAVMLSGETAYGDYPLESVRYMARVVREVEKSKEVKHDIRLISVDNQIGIFLAESAVEAARRLPVKGIVLDTLVGRTARYMAAFRSDKNVYAICYNKRVMRELALSYGIYADYMPQRNSTDDFKSDILNFLLDQKHLKEEDLIVIIGGSFGPRGGASFLEINTIESLLA